MLKTLNPDLLKEYSLEVFAENNANAQPQVVPQIEIKYISTEDHNKPLKKLKKISQLVHDHPAKKYVESRNIPSHAHFRLYYAPKFFAWTNSIIPGKFNLDNGDEPRLVIPFFDKDGNMFGYQGRSFDAAHALRYITIMTKGDHTKVFGLDQLDFDKTVYVVEGPIDSLFIPNSIAMAGSDVNMDWMDKDKTVIVYDNEPRNKEIVNKIEKAIDKGYRVCIWPEIIKQKDINDMVMSGLEPNKLVDIIEENSYKELTALLQLGTWSKV
jgi:hypothetical protein